MPRKSAPNVKWPSASDPVETLGQRIRHARYCARLTPKLVAYKMRISPLTLRSWENGQRPVQADKLPWMAKLFGVSVPWLLDGTGPGPVLPRRLTEVERIMRCL